MLKILVALLVMDVECLCYVIDYIELLMENGKRKVLWYMVIKAVQEHSIGCFTGNGCRNIDVVIDGNTKREKCHSIW